MGGKLRVKTPVLSEEPIAAFPTLFPAMWLSWHLQFSGKPSGSKYLGSQKPSDQLLVAPS